MLRFYLRRLSVIAAGMIESRDDGSLSGAERNASVVVGAQGISTEDVAQLRLLAEIADRKLNRASIPGERPPGDES